MPRMAWLQSWRKLAPGARRAGRTPPAAARQAEPAAVQAPRTAGSQAGWLRVLAAAELLAACRAGEALDGIWRQSRLADSVWRRDLLPAIERHAEFVQLMPASESHHHAHPGGLLVHTLEMLLAALTWRNGHFLPEGASIEQIDAERDAWTYVVFFAALLHDIAKPMTDLRISWRAAQMPEALRWAPVAGSLVQISQGRRQAEYRVEFTPRSLRDYGAHSRLALTILHQVAPPSALSFLARTPHALDVLTQFLCGQDKTSLVAQIVRRADQASTARALLQGSRARFDTATSIPLIELLMNAIKALLRSGTELPLNRSGAAGWVYDGSVWFVAKRLADAVRAWIRHNAPDESIPGENKNDRLFDTWQEYGCIQVNPASGQAVWYVTVHGQGEAGAAQQGEGADPAGYSHSLTLLRFPLARLYDDESQYPTPMAGRIEVRDKRAARSAAAEPEDASASDTGQSAEAVPSSGQELEAGQAAEPRSGIRSDAEQAAHAEASKAKPRPGADSRIVREPSFNKPKPAAAAKARSKTPRPGATHGAPQARPQAGAAVPPAAATPAPTPEPIGIAAGAPDGFEVDDGDAWLDEDDDVRVAARQPAQGRAIQRPMQQPSVQRRAAAPAAPRPEAAAMPQHQAAPGPLIESGQAAVRPLLPAAGQAAGSDAQPAPVLLVPRLPELPQDGAARRGEPSAAALGFMRWLQQGLASREIKYNEAGAPVHFTAEGMALVSLLIFKLYARDCGPEAQADAVGLQIQREVIKAGWHRMNAIQGSGRVNILRYEVLGRGGTPVGKLSAVVLASPERWVLPVPPANPVLRLV